MPSAKKDRVTISLHLNNRIYILLKRCSEFEKEPMSRIVDKVLEPYVEKYESETLDGMEKLDSIMKQERAEIEEQDYFNNMDTINSEDTRLDHFARTLAEFEENQAKYNMPEELVEQYKEYVNSETTKVEQKKIQKLKELHQKESQRWLKIVNKHPLPEGSKRYTVKRIS